MSDHLLPNEIWPPLARSGLSASGYVDGAGNDGMVGELGLGRNSISPGSVLKRDL
jgi:hypothetical protein